MNIVDWFDPNNHEHLIAFKHLRDTGTWPVGFLPSQVEFPFSWRAALYGKITDVYLDSALNE